MQVMEGLVLMIAKAKGANEEKELLKLYEAERVSPLAKYGSLS